MGSTVSAILLKKRGFEVVGAFMRNWDGIDETGVCTADKDCEEAERIAKNLGIQFQTVNLVKEYWNEVFEDMLEDYKQGVTPCSTFKIGGQDQGPDILPVSNASRGPEEDNV